MINISRKDINIHDTPETLLPLVCGQIGYSAEAIPEQLHSKIIDIIDKGLKAIQPDFIIRTTPITACADGRIKAEAVTIDSKNWANLVGKMESPESLCCFIVTLGKQIDIVYESLRGKDLFNQFVLDAFGSVMVEKAADRLEAGIGKQLKKNNYECSRRFSPGYCDWGLKPGQETLCRFLNPEKIGVRCMATGTMIPLKTVSAVMAVAKHMPWKAPCRFCKKRDCPYVYAEGSNLYS